MSSPTRWAGVPLADRRAERKSQLVAAGFEIFGTQGESGLSVRSVCRACGFNTRYFYESFADTDELLGAIYDQVALDMSAAIEAELTAAGDSDAARVRAGIRAVLGFGSGDPRRGRVLFTDARAHPVLIARRAAAQDLLLELTLAEDHGDSDPIDNRVRAAMFTGAMAELAQQWLTGHLGNDLDAVVNRAVATLLR
ncbi:putative TetR family transcriptional regulator [Gordonia effusa NBRC 100432]|uniref:Putative TetR family transcriptional regulator n=1 Tax=Gordonia effusa NBRC 100432 TaxID=1077974 RepID=H0R1G9_9ACTN|nr:TetR family transcriptional regulator [Gordonia effusa]GAB18920.1 putative TetR family transcriptional regulator [Gordonia effusa NBRC 100432]